MNDATYKGLLSRFCGQLGQFRDSGMDRVTAKWLREAATLDDSPSSRRRIVEHSGRVSRTAYALTAIANEKAPSQLERAQTAELSKTLNDLLAEIDRLWKESRRIDDILDDRGLGTLVGETLSSIEFVMDYLQFHFHTGTLSAYNFPEFRKGSSVLRDTDPGYRDALCSLIRKKVERAVVRESEGIELAFEDGSSIEVSLRPKDQRFHEAAEFSSRTGQFWIW